MTILYLVLYFLKLLILTKVQESNAFHFHSRKIIEVCYTYTCEDSIMKPTKHCLQKRGRGKDSGNVMEG
jgi:hypothetical protein